MNSVDKKFANTLPGALINKRDFYASTFRAPFCASTLGPAHVAILAPVAVLALIATSTPAIARIPISFSILLWVSTLRKISKKSQSYIWRYPKL